jgi:hypothetical protein
MENVPDGGFVNPMLKSEGNTDNLLLHTAILVQNTKQRTAGCGLSPDMVETKNRAHLRKTYTLKEIAHRLWKIPNFGKPDEGNSPGKWFYNTIIAWYAIPGDERRFKWESMPSSETPGE